MTLPLHRSLRLCLWLILGLLLTLLWSSGGSFISAPAQTAPPPLYQAGEDAYKQGDYEGAIAHWETLLAATQEIPQRVTLFNNLSLAHQNLQNWDAARTHIEQSLQALGFDLGQQQFPASPREPLLLARTLDIYGKLAYGQGDLTPAILRWQQSESYYRSLGPEQLPALATNQINQAQTLQLLGRQLDAQRVLLNLHHQLEQQAAHVPSTTQVDLWLSLGRIQRLMGDFTTALDVLHEAVTLAESHAPHSIGSISLEMGNTHRALAQRYQALGDEVQLMASVDAAKQAYQQALDQSQSPREASIARLNQLSFEVEQTRWNLPVPNHDVSALVQTLQQDLADLPTDGSTLAARAKFTATLVNLHRANVNLGMSPRELLQFSGETVSQANELGNVRLLSLAWGTLGAVYEQFADNRPTNLDNAFRATEQALAFSMQMGAPEINYRWLWQTGRILHQQGQMDAAIAAYDAAVGAIAAARKALLPINSEVQFSFRDDVEPVYRQYIDLLTFQDTVDNLSKSVEVVDALQLAELENFLGCDLSASVRVDQNLDEIDPNAIFVYPILLENRLEVIVKIPGQPVNHFSTLVSRVEVERRLQKLSTDIRRGSQQREDLETVYTWLIAPLEDQLVAAEGPPKTLVMPLDSYFRSIPIAALIDPDTGEYLVEKPYSLAILPTAQLFNLEPFAAQEQQYLLAGIGEALTVPGRERFAALTLEGEMTAIAQVPNLAQLLNQEVTRDNLARSENAQVIHLITHGKFSSDPEETYLLAYGQEPGTGDLIKAREINQVFRLDGSNPERQLNLLFLAACHTASGDNRAVLGLAGLAVRARAAAAIASLWNVSDRHVGKLAEIFYQELMKPEVTKAEALHRAQQQMARDRQHQNPYDWAPFVIVGNWR